MLQIVSFMAEEKNWREFHRITSEQSQSASATLRMLIANYIRREHRREKVANDTAVSREPLIPAEKRKTCKA